MVEGLDVAVEDRYAILRDESFLSEYTWVREVVQLLEANVIKGNGAKTRSGLTNLGVKVDGLDTEEIIAGYLEGLNQERLNRIRLGGKVNPREEKFRIHYGSLAIMCRVL